MLVKTVCPQCNGIMEVDDSKDRIFCPYCGTQLVNAVQKIEVSGEVKHVIERTDQPNFYITYGSTNQALSMSAKLLPNGTVNTYVTGQAASHRLEPGFHEIRIRVGNRQFIRKFYIREDNAPVRISVVFDGYIHINIEQPEFTNPDGTRGVIDNRDPVIHNGLSNVAFIFSFIPFLAPVSIILAVIDLIIKKKKKKQLSGKTIAALCIAPSMILLSVFYYLKAKKII